jgi:hypothetical protein
MQFSDEQKARLFDRIFEEYVQEHGLGGMAKADLDALIVWLVATELGDFDAFGLSSVLKIKESRVKSLLETAAVKFDQTGEIEAWSRLLASFATVEFDIESLEKGQIRFQLKNPMLFRWLQERVRRHHSTCSYSRQSEQVTVNLDVLYQILDELWQERALGEAWKGRELKSAQAQIKTAVGRIGEKIRSNSLEELRDMKRPRLRIAIEEASRLARIGNLVAPLWKLVKG